MGVGREVVTWMVEKLNLKRREEAVALGEMLMFRGIIVHVTRSEPFVDGDTFYYRFAQVNSINKLRAKMNRQRFLANLDIQDDEACRKRKSKKEFLKSDECGREGSLKQSLKKVFHRVTNEEKEPTLAKPRGNLSHHKNCHVLFFN